MNSKLAIASLFFLLMSCGNTQKMTHSTPLPAFDKQGHRGARGLLPENTIPAMIKALDLGVTTLEMDAVITADKKVILSHEPFFNHEISTGPEGVDITEANEKSFSIFKMTYAETQKFDVGFKPNGRFPRQEKLHVTKPLLADVIDSAEAYAKKKGRPLPFYNIETKTKPSTDNIFHPVPAEFVSLLMNVIEEKKIADRVIIQSFDFRTLKEIHQKYKGVRTAALIEGFTTRSLTTQIDELGFVPDIYSPNFVLVTKSLVDSCHAKGMKVIPWTVNDRPTIDRLKAMGVDGIISDYPDLFTTTE